MDEDFDDLSPEERLEAENNLLKAKLIAEEGALFYEKEDQSLDPYLENQFLKHIALFEKALKNAGKVRIYDFIGAPQFIAASELSGSKLKKELKRMISILEDNGLEVYFLNDCDLVTRYKFITEELFNHKIDNIRIEGTSCSFIYEDFHPNHEQDIKQAASDFLDDLFEQPCNPYNKFHLMNDMLSRDNLPLTRDEFIKAIVLFQIEWKEFMVTMKELQEIHFDIERRSAKVVLKLDYVAGSGEKAKRFSGLAQLFFNYEEGYWRIKKTDIPGFVI